MGKSNKSNEWEIDAAINEQSFSWLEQNHPNIAVAISKDLSDGKTPESIYRRVLATTQRVELALRMRQAAHHVADTG